MRDSPDHDTARGIVRRVGGERHTVGMPDGNPTPADEDVRLVQQAAEARSREIAALTPTERLELLALLLRQTSMIVGAAR